MRSLPLVLLALALACNGDSGDDGDATDSTTTVTGDTGAPTDGAGATTDGDVSDADITEYCAAYCSKYIDCFGAEGPDDEMQCNEDCTGTILLTLYPMCRPDWRDYMECYLALDCVAFENPNNSACTPLIPPWNNETCIHDL